MNEKNIYKQLTDVDISEQRIIWDERGRGYYGEYLVFCELHRSAIGNSKILMNVNLPTDSKNTTEVDLLLIHETGIYVFEIKHYKGTIYGKDTDASWTQYFRTTKNEHFKNPILQNKYHIDALRKIYPDVPIYSCIVFTNNECVLKIQNLTNTADVFSLRNIAQVMQFRFSTNPQILNMDDIDRIFVRLSEYSPMQTPTQINGVEADFLSWVSPIIAELNKAKNELQNEKTITELERKKTKKVRSIFLILCAALVVLLAVISIWSARLGLKKNDGFHQTKSNSSKTIDTTSTPNYHSSTVSSIENPVTKDDYQTILKYGADISKISFKKAPDEGIIFTARITFNDSTYGMVLTEESQYIVTTVSGDVFTYDVFGEHLRYNRNSNTLGIGIRTYGDLAEIKFKDVSKSEDVSKIVITQIQIIELDNSRTVKETGLEMELY